MEKIFAVTKDLGLAKYFEAGPDVRVQLRELFARTRDAVQREKEINLEVVLLIGALEQQNPAVNLCLWGGRKELAEKLGLTCDQYLKRAQAGRVLWRHPEFIDLIRSGKTFVSHVGMLAAKITDANKDIFMSELAGKSEKQVRTLVASVNKDGTRNDEEMTFDLRLTLTKSQIALLERAREVLSATGRLPSDEEAIIQALEDMLEKRDPVRKAERAQKRAEKAQAPESHAAKQEFATQVNRSLSGQPEVPALKQEASPHPERRAVDRIAAKHPTRREPVPAALKHAVTLRDGGRCTYTDSVGRECGATIGVQIDHRIPVARGGRNDLGNLRLLCREHNVMAAQMILGEGLMAQYCGL